MLNSTFRDLNTARNDLTVQTNHQVCCTTGNTVQLGSNDHIDKAIAMDLIDLHMLNARHCAALPQEYSGAG